MRASLTMDENPNEDKRSEHFMDFDHQDVKRLRTDFEHEESSTSSSTSENDSSINYCGDQSASTSSDSGLPQSSTVPSVESSHDTTLLPDETSADATYPIASQTQDQPLQEPGSRAWESDAFSNLQSSSEDTILGTDSESEEEAEEEDVLSKEKPKPTWFLVPEVMSRQYGYTAKKANPALFQQRCYGSLMCVQKLELMYKLEESEGCVNSLNFSADGRLLASGSDDLKVVLWDWPVGKCLLKINTKHKRNIFQTKFIDLKGPDLHLATAGRDGHVWYLQIGNDGLRDSRKLGQHRGPCHKLSVLRDQPQVLLSAGEDGIVFSYDVRKSHPERVVHVKDNSGREVSLYSIHSNPLKSTEFCVAGRENSVRIFDQRKSSRPITKLCPYKSSDEKLRNGLHITCAVYNHDGSEVLASYNDDDIYLFDVDKGSGIYAHKYSGHRNGATIKASVGVSFFGPQSEFIMSGSDCAHVFFWDKKTEAITQFLRADDNGVVNCLEPHPQLPFLATSGLDWDVKLWVPSCEEEPALSDLASTIKENKKCGWGNFESGSESEVLWMLWRRLRAARNRQQEPDGESGFEFLTIDSSDSSSDSRRSASDHEDLDDPAGCTTS
ncbi:hypothetical protein YQE_02903, partial [Dendroctonus ponderosae]